MTHRHLSSLIGKNNQEKEKPVLPDGSTAKLLVQLGVGGVRAAAGFADHLLLQQPLVHAVQPPPRRLICNKTSQRN
jgi:hypothetical protein